MDRLFSKFFMPEGKQNSVLKEIRDTTKKTPFHAMHGTGSGKWIVHSPSGSKADHDGEHMIAVEHLHGAESVIEA